MTYLCISKPTIIGPDDGLSPDRRQAIIWSNTGIPLFVPLGTNFSEFLIEIHTLSFTKIHLKMSSGKWRPFCLCLIVLKGMWLDESINKLNSNMNSYAPILANRLWWPALNNEQHDPSRYVSQIEVFGYPSGYKGSANTVAANVFPTAVRSSRSLYVAKWEQALAILPKSQVIASLEPSHIVIAFTQMTCVM